jgi:hypothetical protein
VKNRRLKIDLALFFHSFGVRAKTVCRLFNVAPATFYRHRKSG